MDGWNTTFLLGRPTVRGYVSFRECRPSQRRNESSSNHWISFQVKNLAGFVLWNSLLRNGVPTLRRPRKQTCFTWKWGCFTWKWGWSLEKEIPIGNHPTIQVIQAAVTELDPRRSQVTCPTFKRVTFSLTIPKRSRFESPFSASMLNFQSPDAQCMVYLSTLR